MHGQNIKVKGGSDVQPVRASGMRGEGVGKDACTHTHTHTHTHTRAHACCPLARGPHGSLRPGSLFARTWVSHGAYHLEGVGPGRLHFLRNYFGSSHTLHIR